MCVCGGGGGGGTSLAFEPFNEFSSNDMQRIHMQVMIAYAQKYTNIAIYPLFGTFCDNTVIMFMFSKLSN